MLGLFASLSTPLSPYPANTPNPTPLTPSQFLSPSSLPPLLSLTRFPGTAPAAPQKCKALVTSVVREDPHFELGGVRRGEEMGRCPLQVLSEVLSFFGLRMVCYESLAHT